MPSKKMTPEGCLAAEKYLDELFSIEKQLDSTIGSDLTVDDILSAAHEKGVDFSEDDLRSALSNKLRDRSVSLVRFSFSESPCG